MWKTSQERVKRRNWWSRKKTEVWFLEASYRSVGVRWGLSTSPWTLQHLHVLRPQQQLFFCGVVEAKSTRDGSKCGRRGLQREQGDGMSLRSTLREIWLILRAEEWQHAHMQMEITQREMDEKGVRFQEQSPDVAGRGYDQRSSCALGSTASGGRETSVSTDTGRDKVQISWWKQWTLLQLLIFSD